MTGEPRAAGGVHMTRRAFGLLEADTGIKESSGASGRSGAQQKASLDHARPSHPTKALALTSKCPQLRPIPRARAIQRLAAQAAVAVRAVAARECNRARQPGRAGAAAPPTKAAEHLRIGQAAAAQAPSSGCVWSVWGCLHCPRGVASRRSWELSEKTSLSPRTRARESRRSSSLALCASPGFSRCSPPLFTPVSLAERTRERKSGCVIRAAPRHAEGARGKRSEVEQGGGRARRGMKGR
eukprot:scaffold250956_cov35-Tisochrysis_lutea.AAC.3